MSINTASTHTGSESSVDTRLPENGFLSPALLRSGALLVSGAMLGFALILWLAANWDGLDKAGRFAIAGATLGAGGFAALASASLAIPGLLVAFLATGGMLALIGQTYQTGADTWQLFAAWAALGLPFALAARHDAIWTPLIAVFFCALTLWQSTTELSNMYLLSRWGETVASSSPMLLLLASWLPALGVCVLLEPFTIAARFAGSSTRWAFRLAVVLTLVNVAGWGIAGLLTGEAPLWSIVLLAACILAGLACWQSLRGERDPLLLASIALSVDAFLICGLGRAVFNRGGVHHDTFAQFFILGIGGALIVAASVVLMLRVIRGELARGSSATAVARTATAATIDQARPWAAVVLSAIGAMFAAVPLMVAFGLLLGNVLMRSGPSAYAVGALVAGLGLSTLRQSRSLFVEQLAAIAFATGLGLLIFALFRDLPDGLASLILAMASFAVAIVIAKPWLGGILGAIGTTALAYAAAKTFGTHIHPGTAAYFVTWAAMAVACAAAMLALDANRNWLEPLPSAPSLDAIVAGGGIAVLGALSVVAGATFLFDGMIGTRLTRVHASDLSPTLGPLAMWFTLQRVLGVALAAAGCAALVRMYPALRTPAGIACIATAVLMAFVMPRLGPVVLVLGVAATSGRRNLAVLAAAAAIWIVGNFYYALALTLTQKAAILGVAGVVLGAIAYASRSPYSLSPSLRGEDDGPPIAPTSLPALLPQTQLARAVTAAGLVFAGGVSAHAIHSKEALIRDGRPVFVELAPVDPRSLMQGDYMALRFRLPDGALRHQSKTGARPVAIGAIDTSGFVKLTRIGTPREPIGRDEIRIELTPVDRGWTIVTNAWFFKEGTAKKLEAARYGEFRVLPDGRALLVALADKDRLGIKP